MILGVQMLCLSELAVKLKSILIIGKGKDRGSYPKGIVSGMYHKLILPILKLLIREGGLVIK